MSEKPLTIHEEKFLDGVIRWDSSLDVIGRFDDKFDFLSNFYKSTVEFDGMGYSTAEHAYQAQKAVRYRDQLMIRAQATPALAKKVGRTIEIRSDWEIVKLSVMLEVVSAKFSNRALAAKLLTTGMHKLVEGNWWHDTYWGVCNGKGENMLGRVLMLVREELR